MLLTNPNKEVLIVTEFQFKELQELGAVSPNGLWLKAEKVWEVLAIGLDQIPGATEILIDLDRRVLN